MKELFLVLFAISLVTNCTTWERRTGDKPARIENIPKPDQALAKAHEKHQELNVTGCVFSDPDTSVSGIVIRKEKSTRRVLGDNTKLEGDSTHVFYSSDSKQKLELSVHPGDNYNQVSVFEISSAKISKQSIAQLHVTEFETEKGIKLGISKREIIEKLGTCYVAKDSTKIGISLYYRLELPNDSKTEILKKNNLPIYFAKYRFTNDKLENIEFGFEYP